MQAILQFKKLKDKIKAKKKRKRVSSQINLVKNSESRIGIILYRPDMIRENVYKMGRQCMAFVWNQ